MRCSGPDRIINAVLIICHTNDDLVWYLKRVEVLPTEYGQPHDVAAVPLVVELQQTVPHTKSLFSGNSVERLLVASPELGEVVGGVSRGLLYLIDPPGVVGNILLVFGVHSIHLPLCGRFSEQRRQEELGADTGTSMTRYELDDDDTFIHIHSASTCLV